MENLKLIGVVIVIVGFLIKWDTIATVILAGIVTGLIAGMSFGEILEILGSSFISQRMATLFVLTLPIIGICERYGLKEKAMDLIQKAKNITAGKIISIYTVIRNLASVMSLRLNGQAQFVRPLIEPMASAAAAAEHGKLTEKSSDRIKAFTAAGDNYGNFFAQNCFMGAPGVLLIVSTLKEHGQPVDALQIVIMCIPVAIIALAAALVQNYMLDRSLKKEYAKTNENKTSGDAKE